jgi:ATP-binding cassette subfamily B protein
MNGRAFWAIVGTFFALGPALVFVVAAWQLSSGSAITFTAGTIVAFTALQNRMFWPVGELFGDFVQLLASFALFERVFEYLDLRPDLADAPGAVAGERRCAVESGSATFASATTRRSTDGRGRSRTSTSRSSRGSSRRSSGRPAPARRRCRT